MEKNNLISIKIVVKTAEISLENVETSIPVSHLTEIIAQKIFEPARSIKLLCKDRILSKTMTVAESGIQSEDKIIVLPCYTMKHGLWNFIDDFNHQQKEMQDIDFVYFLQDKLIEKDGQNGKLEKFQPIGVYWKSRTIIPMPYLENDFSRIEKKVGRVKQVFEFGKGNHPSVSIIFRECEKNLENVLNSYTERISSKFPKGLATNVALDIVFSSVLDQSHYWYQDGNFKLILSFFDRLPVSIPKLTMNLQRLNLDGVHLLMFCNSLRNKATTLKNLTLILRDNSFEGELVEDIGKSLAYLTSLEQLEIDLQNVIIYNQLFMQLFFESLSLLKNLKNLIVYFPKDLSITFFTSETLSLIFGRHLSDLQKLERLQFYIDSRIEIKTDFIQSLQYFLSKSLISDFSLVSYSDTDKCSQTNVNLLRSLLQGFYITQLKIMNYNNNDALIQHYQYKETVLLTAVAFFKHISSLMAFKPAEIFFDLFD